MAKRHFAEKSLLTAFSILSDGPGQPAQVASFVTDDDMKIILASVLTSSVLTSLAGVLFTAAIGFWVTTWHEKRKARRAAASELRAAFAPELAIVRTTPHNIWTSWDRILGDPKADLNEILRAAFERRHAPAIEKFRFFVPASSRAAYDAASQDYYLEGTEIGFFRYMYGESGQADFFRHVDAIFRFAH
jgi:hypothetical protein